MGLKRKGIFLRRDGARCPDLGKGTGPMNEGGQSPDREKAGRASVSSNYWSSTTNANNSNNAWTLCCGGAKRRLLRESELGIPTAPSNDLLRSCSEGYSSCGTYSG